MKNYRLEFLNGTNEEIATAIDMLDYNGWNVIGMAKPHEAVALIGTPSIVVLLKRKKVDNQELKEAKEEIASLHELINNQNEEFMEEIERLERIIDESKGIDHSGD